VSGFLTSVALAKEEVKTLERTIQKLEQEIKKTENSFIDLVFGSAPFNAAQKKLADLKKELDDAMIAWENSQG